MDNNVAKIAANANFFIQSKAAKNKENAKTEEKPAQEAQVNAQKKDPDAIFDAMQVSAMQNKAIAFGKFVNPKDHLSEDRIKDIEASMGAFEAANEKTLDAMNQEFKGVSAWSGISEAQKLAMAASMQNI